MLERVRSVFLGVGGREAYFAIIKKHFPYGSDDYKLIEKAYDTAQSAFHGRVREGNGERYFEHLLAVSLILLIYMRVRDAEVIAAALLHDILEDIEGWTQERIALEFTQRVSLLVWWVTKPPVADFNGDKEARNRAYHLNLWRAPRESLLVKLADRLHNLLTMWGVDNEKQRRKVQETQDFYLPLAEEQIVLIHEIEDALKEIMAGWKVTGMA